jgi:hypothetical protein
VAERACYCGHFAAAHHDKGCHIGHEEGDKPCSCRGFGFVDPDMPPIHVLRPELWDDPGYPDNLIRLGKP